MNWSYRGSWLENDTPPCHPGPRPAPGPATPRYCTLWPPSPARRPTMASQLNCSRPGQRSGVRAQPQRREAGTAAGCCPVSEVPAPCGLLREVACRLPACVSVYFLLFLYFFFLSFYFFLIPPRGESRGTGAGSRGGVGEGMMDGSGSRPPAPRGGVSTRAPGPSGMGSGASAGGPRHRPHRRPRPRPHLPRKTSCPV